MIGELKIIINWHH